MLTDSSVLEVQSLPFRLHGESNLYSCGEYDTVGFILWAYIHTRLPDQ